jgi:hypothetical protein
VTRPLAVSSIFTVIPYGIAVRYLYPSLGVWVGTVSSYVIILPLGYLAYRLVRMR